MSPRLRVGNRVRVNENSGMLSGKEGYLIPKDRIPMFANGVLNFPDNPVPVDPKEVGVQQDDGSIFVIHMNTLAKLSED
jgi:hypothetical protein